MKKHEKTLAQMLKGKSDDTIRKITDLTIENTRPTGIGLAFLQMIKLSPRGFVKSLKYADKLEKGPLKFDEMVKRWKADRTDEERKYLAAEGRTP